MLAEDHVSGRSRQKISEWMPREVCCPLLFILSTSEIFELVKTRLYANANDSTLLVVVHKPVDRPAVTTSLYRDLARIRGRVDDLSFFDYSNPFCFLSIEFHYTFSISYKILPYFVYYYCILVWM